MDIRTKVLKKIDEMENEIIAQAKELINIPSEIPPCTSKQISKAIAQKMNELGLTVQTVEAPEEWFACREQYQCWLPFKAPRIAVIGKLRGKVGNPTLLWYSHSDTVPVTGGWSLDPFEGIVKVGGSPRTRRLYGRGAADAKSNIAVELMAIKALREVGVELKGNITMFIVPDEEMGGPTLAYLVQEGFLQGDFLMATSGPINMVNNALNGVLHWEITTLGKSAHAMRPSLGINAIEKMMKIMTVLMEYKKSLASRTSKIEGIEHPTLTIGMVQGGVKPNVVPDSCYIAIDRRVIPEETINEVRTELRNLLNKAKREDPELKIRVRELLWATPSISEAEDSFVQEYMKIVRDILGEDVPIKGMPGFIDLHFCRELRIPFVHQGCNRGAAESKMHAGDENVRVDDILKLTKIYALSAMKFCGSYHHR